MSLRDAAIVGIHTTQQALHIDRAPLSLCLEAARAAVADAGLQMSDIDGICAAWMGPGGTQLHPGAPDWATLLGIPIDWMSHSYPAGVPALLDAAAAISAGLCSTVLVVGGQSRTRVPGAVIAYTRPDNEFTACYGSYTSAQFALVAQRYLHVFGMKPESKPQCMQPLPDKNFRASVLRPLRETAAGAPPAWPGQRLETAAAPSSPGAQRALAEKARAGPSLR